MRKKVYVILISFSHIVGAILFIFGLINGLAAESFASLSVSLSISLGVGFFIAPYIFVHAKRSLVTGYKETEVDYKEIVYTIVISVLPGFGAGFVASALGLKFSLSTKANLFLGLGIGSIVTFFILLLRDLGMLPKVLDYRWSKLRIYELVGKLGKQYRAINLVDKAKLRIFLMSIIMPRRDFEFKTTIEHYIDFQIAGAFFAQEEMLTTYTAQIEDWNRLCVLLERYTRSIKEKKAIGKKERYIVRPLAEIISCLEQVSEYEIFLDTITMGATLWLVPEEILKKRGCAMEDFLLYDDRIVIIGDFITKGESDKDTPVKGKLDKDTPTKVTIIVDPELRHTYLGYKSKLKELKVGKDRFKLDSLESKAVQDTLLSLRAIEANIEECRD